MFGRRPANLVLEYAATRTVSTTAAAIPESFSQPITQPQPESLSVAEPLAFALTFAKSQPVTKPLAITQPQPFAAARYRWRIRGQQLWWW